MRMKLSVLNTKRTQPDPAKLPPIPIDGLYIHIPFCFHKCHYCDFYSITHQTPQRMDLFVQRILDEADFWQQSPVKPAIKTIFFGGGTPTLLPLDAMQRLIEGIRARFDLSQLNEWTTEANPATVTLEYCDMLKQSGITRMSFGAQSFDRHELKVLERHHNPDDVPRSLEMARQAGFDRLSLDLIYAIPGQDVDSWEHSLKEALSLNTTHLSCYGLTYEPNTAIAVRKRLGRIQAVDDTVEVQMFRKTRQILHESGLKAYEISNYSVDGQQCRHNLMYWTGGSYIGLGPSAASHVQGRRWRNKPHLGEWERTVGDRSLPAIEYEQLSPMHRARELVMLMLRLSQGVIFRDFARITGINAHNLFKNTLNQLSGLGLIELDEQGFHLAQAGLPVADAIAAEFLTADN